MTKVYLLCRAERLSPKITMTKVYVELYLILSSNGVTFLYKLLHDDHLETEETLGNTLEITDLAALTKRQLWSTRFYKWVCQSICLSIYRSVAL